jgi:small conductance mechanosensitive channel
MFALLAQLPAAVAAAPAASAPSGENASSVYDQALQHVMHFKFSELTQQQWLVLAEQLGLRAALVIVLMVLAMTVSGWAATAVRATLKRLKFDETLTLFFAKFVRYGILGMAGIACVSHFGVDTTSLAAVIGAAGFAIGLAFQGTLSNFAAGAMLLIFRPYKVGDVVNVAGQLGKVDEIELFTTTINTFDNRRILIPNSSIYGSIIENITHHRKRRIDVDVGVAYAADIDATRKALMQALDSVQGVLLDPAPEVVLMGLGNSSVDWQVRAWAPTTEFLNLKQQVIRAVKMHLDEAGLEIPFPQMDIHVKQDAAAASARLAA